jgi:hypothetical protein
VPEFDNTWLIEVPDPADAPEIPVPFVAVHEKVVPEVKLLKLIEVAAPEHIVADAGVAVTKGIGFTVTITGTDEPVQELALGTIL